MSFITIATEDELSEAVAVRLVSDFLPNFDIRQSLGKTGNGYLQKQCLNFNKMALRHPVFLITDLDNIRNANDLKNSWFKETPISMNLIFRVAVREIESWLLADHAGMRTLLNKGAFKIVSNPDHLPNPKEYLLNCAKRAPGKVRRDLIRLKGKDAKQGLGYNSCLCQFIKSDWQPKEAAERSDSLRRAILRLKELRK